MPFYDIQDIVIAFDEVEKPVLKGVSFSVPQGEILSLIGESGCGKTTLLNIMAGLIEQNSGDVFFQDKRLLRPSEHLMKGHKKIKLVEQYAALLPNHNVYDNITFKLRNFVPEYQKQKVDELLELTNLVGFEERKPRDLSGGQRQRLAIACALADEPSIILFDEPFSHLDNGNKIRLMEDIRDIIKDAGITAIFVTHNGEEALCLSDRIIVMKEGEILEEGTPDEIYYQPKYQYSSNFFGYTNFLSKDDLKCLGFVTKNQSPVYGVKAESIVLDEKGVEVEVVDSLFMGSRKVVMFELPNEKYCYCYLPGRIKVGDKIKISLVEEEVFGLE